MSNIKELKDEDLEKVSGGWLIIPPDCADFTVMPKYDMSEEAKKYNWVISYSCKDCVYWQGPEGPCTLGH